MKAVDFAEGVRASALLAHRNAEQLQAAIVLARRNGTSVLAEVERVSPVYRAQLEAKEAVR